MNAEERDGKLPGGCRYVGRREFDREKGCQSATEKVLAWGRKARGGKAGPGKVWVEIRIGWTSSLLSGEARSRFFSAGEGRKA